MDEPDTFGWETSLAEENLFRDLFSLDFDSATGLFKLKLYSKLRKGLAKLSQRRQAQAPSKLNL